MNRKAFLAVFALPLLILASCSGKYDFVQKPLEDNSNRGLLTLGNNDAKLSINSLGEYYDKVVFTADEDWTVSGPSDWEKWINLKVKGNGSIGKVGTSDIEITVRPNFNVDHRSAELSFIGKESNNVLAVLTVDQDAISFSIKGDSRMDFKWSEFQLMDGDKPAANQRYARTLTVTSNVAWSIERQEEAEEFFVITTATEKGSNNGTITVVPKEPGLRDQDVLSLLRIIPDIEKTSIKREDLTDEELADIDELAMGMELSQDHLLFLARWDEESDPVFSELGGDLGSGPASFSVTTEDGTSWTLESLESSWLSITGNSGNLGPDPVEGPATLGVRPIWANPSAERREFSIVISPILPEEVLAGISQDVQERLNVTLHGAQKGLVFQVTENGRELTSYGHDFDNEDVGNEARQEYKVKVKTSAPFEQFCAVTDSYDWIDYDVRPDSADSTYVLTFFLSKQNLDTNETISTPLEGANYQNSGYAYFGSRAPANGEQYFVRPDPALFAPTDVSPSGALFVFSQKAFDFWIYGEWPEILRAGLPAMSGGARYPVKFVSSGSWEATVIYDPGNNENVDERNWVKEQNNIFKGSKGTFDLGFGSGSSNAYDHDRSAQVVFESLNHKAAGQKLQLVYDVKQRKFVFIVREGADAGSAEVENMQVAAYQPADEPFGLYLECGSKWEITRCPSFLVPLKRKSSSEEDLNIMLAFDVKPNTSSIPRPEDEIEITAYLEDGRTTTKTVKVSQDAFVFDVSQSLPTLEPYYGSETSVGSITLTKGVKWRVTTPGGKDYSGDKVASGITEDLLFTPETNLDAGDRSNVTYRVEIVEPAGVAPKTLSFRQKGFEFDLSDNKAEFTELKTLSRSITLHSSGPWDVTSEVPGWLHISSPSGDASSELTISVDANTNRYDLRSREIVFESRAHKDAGRTLKKSLNVSQKAFKWNLTVSGLLDEFVPVDNESFYVNIVSSGPWEFKGLPDWIEASQSSGDGNEDGYASQVRLTVKDNLTVSPRKSNIFVASTVSGTSYSEEITVSQSRFIWGVGTCDFSWSSAINLIPTTFNVTCSGPWEIRDENDKPVSNLNGWTFTPSFSTGSPKGVIVTVTPVPNDSRSARSAVFYVVSKKHGKSSSGIGSQRGTLSMPGYELHAGDVYAETYNCPEFSPWNPSDGLSDDNPQTLEIPVKTTPGAGWDIEVKPEDSWIEVVNTSSNIATLKVANHTGDAPRDAHMTLKSTEPGITLTQDVLLTQKGFEFSANPEKLELQPTPSQQTVTITCSGGWEVESYDRSMVTSASRNGNQLVLDISESQEPRGSTVVLKSHGRQLQYLISQGIYVFDISGLSSNATLSTRASDGVANVSLTSNVEWWIESCPDWLQTSIAVGSHQTPSNINTGNTYNFTVRPRNDNLTGEQRTGTLVLMNNVEKSGRSYSFTQDGFEFGNVIVDQYEAFRDDASADKRTVVFASSLPWAIPTQYPFWLHVNPTSGDGSGRLEVWVDNNNGDARSAYFEIKDTKYSLTRKVNISQKAFVWTVSGTSHNFPPVNPQAWTFEVESSAPVTITPDDESWIRVTSIPAGRKTTVTVTANPNLEQNERSASLLIEARAAGKSSTVTLTQDAFKFNLTLDGSPVTSGTEVYYGPGGGNRAISVDCSGGWHLDAVPGWLTIDKEQSKVIFKSSANSSGARHEDVITIVCEDNTNLNVTTKHIQDVFSVSPASLNMFGPLDTGTQNISISATGAWTVSGPAWVNLDPASGTGSGTVQVSVKNNTGVQRSDDITVTYTPEGLAAPETRKVSVSQEKLEFSLTPEFLTFGSKGAISQQIAVTANIDWQVSTDHTEWLSVSAASGSVTVVPLSDNAATSPRSATVTVSSSLVPSISRTVSVTQNAPQAPEAVDLGLTSGLKWASMNVGASSPEDYGAYFAWGETQPKSNYDWSSYKWCNGSENTQTKYNTSSSYGTVDNKTVIDPEDDAAHVNWGGSWRMPTDEEWTELRTNCTWTWTTQNGVNGRLVTGPNGKSIFLPAAGYRYDANLFNAGSWGYYWSSSLTTVGPFIAWGIRFYSDDVSRSNSGRYDGFSVRPVSE